jgi:hypothetical protein
MHCRRRQRLLGFVEHISVLKRLYALLRNARGKQLVRYINCNGRQIKQKEVKAGNASHPSLYRSKSDHHSLLQPELPRLLYLLRNHIVMPIRIL